MRVRIPGIIDLASVSERDAIREAAANSSLDRQFVPAGPLINRLLLSRVCLTLTSKGKRLPSIAPRNDRERIRTQATLQRRLDDVAKGNVIDNETLQAIVDAIRGKPGARALAIAAQQAVGRWFEPGYIANRRTWQAARELQAAASSKNIVYAVYLFLSGKMRRAQRSLGRRVDGDRAGIHATGIAIHNIVRGFEEMQRVWHDQSLRRRLSKEAVLGRCMFAPQNVLRQATENGVCSFGTVKPGTLILLSLEAARSRDPGNDMNFMSHSWSHCPGEAAVIELFRTVWLKLNADESRDE